MTKEDNRNGNACSFFLLFIEDLLTTPGLQRRQISLEVKGEEKKEKKEKNNIKTTTNINQNHTGRAEQGKGACKRQQYPQIED